MSSIKKTARMAGFHYLMYFVTSVIANRFGRFIFVDAPVTVNQVMAHEAQFRIGFVISLLLQRKVASKNRLLPLNFPS